MDNLEKAQQCIDRMKEFGNKVEFPWGIFYRLSKAAILKRKPQKTYHLQAKEILIIFEFKEAQTLLNQARDTAEKFGLNRLAKRITNEQDNLSKNFIKWEKMKISRENISVRMDLARIDEQIKLLLRKQIYIKNLNKQA
jgi:hypothetical protein